MFGRAEGPAQRQPLSHLEHLCQSNGAEAHLDRGAEVETCSDEGGERTAAADSRSIQVL